MTVQYRNVEGLSEPPGYAHFAVGVGERVMFTAGQVPLDADGSLVGRDDPMAQTEQVLSNLLATLEAAGATPDDVVKITVYVVGTQEDLPAVWEVVRGSPVGRGPSTLLGVERLGYTGQLVEIEAVCVL